MYLQLALPGGVVALQGSLEALIPFILSRLYSSHDVFVHALDFSILNYDPTFFLKTKFALHRDGEQVSMEIFGPSVCQAAIGRVPIDLPWMFPNHSSNDSTKHRTIFDPSFKYSR